MLGGELASRRTASAVEGDASLDAQHGLTSSRHDSTLYRWEVNIRASAVLGVVGAGGLGGLLHVSLNLFHHHRTLTLLAVIVLLVTAVDFLSGAIRRRILEGPPAEARRLETPAVWMPSASAPANGPRPTAKMRTSAQSSSGKVRPRFSRPRAVHAAAASAAPRAGDGRAPAAIAWSRCAAG